MSHASCAPAFRFAGLWQWNPVSCVSPRSYDEKYMMRHSDWFFDRSFMGRYFDAMRAAGLNTWTLANTHPFPFMVDLREFPDAVVLSDADLARYQSHYHRLFETARAKGVKPFVLFHTCYVPDRFGEKRAIRPTHSYEPPKPACDYTRSCVRRLCDAYPELEGIYGEASENVARDLRSQFARDAIVAGIHDSRARPVLFFRGWISDPQGMKENVLDAYQGECFFTVKYTWEFLVHRKPDPEFLRWVAACGGARVLPEFWISNYQPFGCHDVELARGLREEIAALGCPGFTSHPMDLYGAPFVQGAKRNALQLDRDRDWYATLSGQWDDGAAEAAERFGVADKERLGAAMRCASRPHRMSSFYMTGNKQNFLQPQLLAAICGTEERRAGVQTTHSWSQLAEQTAQSYGRWMEQIDGRAVRYPNEHKEGFGLDDSIEQIETLLAQWREPPEESEKDKEVYDVWRRDVLAQRLTAQAWTERARAVSAHFSGNAEDVKPALRKSLDRVRRLPATIGYDGPYRLLVGRHTFIIRWSELIAALEDELAEYGTDAERAHHLFGAAEQYDRKGKDFA